MTIHVNIGEAKTQLSKLVAAALRGEKIVLDKAGQPQVELVPVNAGQATQAVQEKRAAWIGSGEGKYPKEAGDLFLEPTFTDEEMDAFDTEPNL